MLETVLVLVQAFVVALEAAWLSLGAYENVRHPEDNRSDVAKVLALEALERHPHLQQAVASRRITDPAIVRAIFRLVVVAEMGVTLALWAAVLMLLGAALGLVGHDLATAVALVAGAGFTAIWAGFLIGGQWFYYWHGAFGQESHFKLAIWGVATLVLVAL